MSAIELVVEYAKITTQLAKEAAADLAKLHTRNDKMESALEAISNWTKAYPLSVFPEPDFKRVRELLEAGGITLDSVSASNMRYVIEEVAELCRDGLSEDP